MGDRQSWYDEPMIEPSGEDPILRAEAQVHVALADGRAFSLSVASVRFSEAVNLSGSQPLSIGSADEDVGLACTETRLFHNLSGEAHLSWSCLADVERRRCATLVVGNPSVPSVLRERLVREPGSRHPLVRRALAEVLAAGRLPYPDTIGAPSEIVRTADGVELRIAFPDERIACELVLAPGRPGAGERSLASWIPRCDVEGTIVIDGIPHAARGTGTYFEASAPSHERAIVHLDDTDIHVWRDGARVRAIVDGAEYGASLTPLATWTSHYTFHDFGVAWRLHIPEAQVEVELRATFNEQELVTMTAGEPLWRGRCDVTGAVAGRRVGGVAFLEQTARDAAATLPDFFATIPRETRRAIQRELPLPLTIESVLAILGGDLGRYVRDVDREEFQRILIQPIRDIMDRMGKAWRSYGAVMCYHALRGDKFRRDSIDALLALTEVIHVGSLIVDDVEDDSPTRRGGPACHVAHSVPIAINAGTFCYFVWQSWFARLGLGSAAKLQIYESYFEFMRLAHLGQALDIQGFTRSMTDEIVETGEVALLTRQMQNVYVLKTGAPASVFARIGAIVAGGSEVAVRALGELFEALGIAFQIMDDVQNLKGFVGDPKHCEDLTHTKVTMPVLEAMRVLEQRDRRDLWERIVRCGQEPLLVPSIVDTLDRCGAFAACRDQANVLIENAWRGVAPLLEDSIAKVMLRSFCFYVVECLG